MTDTALRSSHGYDRVPLPVALIPPDQDPVGPITRRKQRRALVLLAGLALVGVLLAWLPATASWRAFGLGLVLPGGGFLLHATGGVGVVVGHVLLFVLSLVIFLLAFFVWVMTGNVLAPVVVWLGTALWAQFMHGSMPMAGWPGARVLVPVLAGLTVWGLHLFAAREAATGLRRREEINGYLPGRQTVVTVLDESTGLPEVEEMSAEQLASLRFVLDRALQPVDRFDGYDRIDEFRESAKRYQTSISSYALSGLGYSHLPALRGYLAQAQHNLGLKMQDHRVWKYWAVENFWGALRLDPNPIERDNIMYTGWYAAMLGMIASTVDDHSFNRPAGLHLVRPNGRSYDYSFEELCAVLHRNFLRSDVTLFPCEPGWIYPMCNNFGAIALVTCDRLYGTSYWPDVEEPYRRSVEREFLRLDGHLTGIRHSTLGFAIPGMTATMPDGAAAYYLNPMFPDLARRVWETMRHDTLRLAGDDVEISVAGWDLIDFGNYRPSRFSTYTVVAAVAREMGDDEVADAIVAKIEAMYPPEMVDGVRRFPGVSVGAQAFFQQALSMRPNAMRDIVQVGLPEPWRTGPVLNEVTYPDVLVARAVSDGAALDLVLHPGRAGGSRQVIGLAQLRPEATYRLSGALDELVTADGEGKATVSVDLAGRTAVLVQPVA